MPSKEYQRAWRSANKDKANAYARDWYAKNREKSLQKTMDWKSRNKEKVRAIFKAWSKTESGKRSQAKRSKNITLLRRLGLYVQDKKNLRTCDRRWKKNNPDKVLSSNAIRRASRIMATPPWVDKIELGKIYSRAVKKTHSTGNSYHVDHIWPLKGNDFSGLHVPWNLQIISALENLRKKNYRPTAA